MVEHMFDCLEAVLDSVRTIVDKGTDRQTGVEQWEAIQEAGTLPAETVLDKQRVP